MRMHAQTDFSGHSWLANVAAFREMPGCREIPASQLASSCTLRATKVPVTGSQGRSRKACCAVERE